MKVRLVDVTRVITGSEPITLTQAKAWCRVDYTDDDALITSLIPQARRRIENYCHLSIIASTVTAYLTYVDNQNINYALPSYGVALTPLNIYQTMKPVELPFGPVIAVSSVVSVDNNGTNVTLDPTAMDYYIRGGNFKTIQVNNQLYGNATVTYTAGYTTIPDDLLEAIYAEIAFSLQNRGDEVNRYAQQSVGISQRAQALSAEHIRYQWL